jgi:hypothetical protein
MQSSMRVLKVNTTGPPAPPKFELDNRDSFVIMEAKIETEKEDLRRKMLLRWSLFAFFTILFLVIIVLGFLAVKGDF